MRYPLSPQNGEGGRVSSLRSAWEGKSPVNKEPRTTVLPSEVRSKEKSRAKQSWRSASGQENTSVPAWRATPERSSWKTSSSSPYTKREVTSLSPGPRLKSPGRIASPGSASKALSARSNDYIRKWQTIGSPDADAHSTEVYRSTQKDTISPSVPKAEVYRSQNEPDSPATLTMTYSIDDSIPPIKMSDTADSPSMNKLRNDLESMSFSNHKSETNEEKKYHPAVQVDPKEQVEEEEGDDEESIYNIERSVTSRSNASSSLVYSLEDTIPSVAHSRKSKESLKSVMERLKQTASSSSQSSHDGTETTYSAGLIASDLVASTLAECRLLLQMSPAANPNAVNTFAEPRKEVVEPKDESSDRAIQPALSMESVTSDNTVAQLMRCPCCSHKFAEAGEHEPLHSFACEHIICRECVFSSTSKTVSCPECGEEGAFNKAKPVVSRSYLRLIKKMGDSSSVKTTKKNDERFKDSPMSVPSQINFGGNGKHSNDDISVFSSVSGHIQTNKLVNRYRDLAKQIDADSVSLMSKPNPPPSVKSSFTINPKQVDVSSVMSESHCIPASDVQRPVNGDYANEAESMISEYHSSAKSRLTAEITTSAESDYYQPNASESSTLPPQEPSTPVSRAEYRFHQRKQRLAESLEKVNKVLAKSRDKNMSRICEEEASVASSRHSSMQASSASVASSRVASSSIASSRHSSMQASSASVASSRVTSSSSTSSSSAETNSFTEAIKAAAAKKQAQLKDDMTHSTAGSTKDTTVSSIQSKTEVHSHHASHKRNEPKAKSNSKESKNRFKAQLLVDTGTQPSPLSVHNTQPSPTPMVNAQQYPIPEEASPEECSPCESAKSEHTTVSNFDPFGDDPFADNVFVGSNVFRGDDVPSVGFGDFIRDATSSADTEHENAFLLPEQKDTKYKPQPQPVQQLSEANRCAQFLPSLAVSKNGFIGMDSPNASGKNTNKRVKKKQQQYSSAKPQKLSQKVFKSFSRSFDEATNAGGFSGNQDWRFQEQLPKPPSIESSDDDEDENPPLYEFSEGSCSHSPSDADNMKASLSTLVTHKKGFRVNIRDKMKKKIGNKKYGV